MVDAPAVDVAVSLSAPRGCGGYRIYTQGAATPVDPSSSLTTLRLKLACRISLPGNPSGGFDHEVWNQLVRPRAFWVVNVGGRPFSDVRWRGWGRRSARGRGVYTEHCEPLPGGGLDRRCPNGPVRILLSDAGFCAAMSGGQTGLAVAGLVYRRMRVSGRRR